MTFPSTRPILPDSLGACPPSRTSSTCCTAGTRPARPTPGTPSAWCTATRAARVDKVMFAVDPTLRGRPRGRRLGRGPAGRAPPALPQAGARVRGDHAEGPHARHARRRGLRAADRAHQRRPGAWAGSPRRSRERLGLTDIAPLLPAPAAAMDKLTTSTSRSRTPRRCAPAWPRPAPAGSATTTTRRSRPPAPAGSGRSPAPNPAIGTVGEIEAVAEERIEVVLPARPPVGRRRARCWRRTPTRSRRTTWSSWPTPGSRRPAPAGSARSPATTLRRVRRDGRRRAARDGARRTRRRATRTGRYAGWRCAAARATSCSTRSRAPTPTST